MSEAASGGDGWPRFGLTTRFGAHVPEAALTFWETKDVLGVERPLAPGAVPSVSLFADNRLATAHPDWVQVGPGGERAVRGGAPYFDWAVLCPSRAEVRERARRWVAGAIAAQEAGPASLRVSDVGFAREGYCLCPACREGARARDMDPETYRRAIVADAMAEVRALVPGRLYVTVYPDPYPGHLERRFGLDPDGLAGLADAYVVPLYDLAYATTHWLETLCQGFADRLGGVPWYAELYGLGVQEDRLRKALTVAAAYATGVLVAYDRDLERVRRLREAVVAAR